MDTERSDVATEGRGLVSLDEATGIYKNVNVFSPAEAMARAVVQIQALPPRWGSRSLIAAILETLRRTGLVVHHRLEIVTPIF